MARASNLPPALKEVLEVARWAPSGDNAQPWRFQVLSDDSVILHVRCATENVYEYAGGQPTLISAGTLLENIELAAAAFNRRAKWQYLGATKAVHSVKILIEKDAGAIVSPLFSEIERRSVDRRPYKMRPLTENQKALLAGCLHDGIHIHWFEGLGARARIARLTAAATQIRLRIPETFDVHTRIVDWESAQSTSRIPAAALGLDPITLKVMRWTLAHRHRAQIANALGSPSVASLQMDILPGVFSGAYFVLTLDGATQSAPDAMELLKAGQSVQRFWLEAASLGLVMQPCLAPLAFAYYGRHQQTFTVHYPSQRAAVRLSEALNAIVRGEDRIVFLGRLGWPRSPIKSRSLRVPLDALFEAASGGDSG